MRRVLIDDDDTIGPLVHDVAVKHLDQGDPEALCLFERGLIGGAHVFGIEELSWDVRMARAGPARSASCGQRPPFTDRRSRHERSECRAHRLLYDAFDADAIAKSNL